MLLSVGFTRLLLANGAAPDRSLFLPSCVRPYAGSPSPSTAYTRSRTRPSPASSPDPPYASCITASTCDSLPHTRSKRNRSAGMLSIWDRTISLARPQDRRRQRSGAWDGQHARQALIFRHQMSDFGDHLFGQESHRSVPGIRVFAVVEAEQ